MKLNSNTGISNLLDLFSNTAKKYEFEFHAEMHEPTRQYQVTISKAVPTQKITTRTITRPAFKKTYPATWWEGVKSVLMPKIFLDKFPVKMEEIGWDEEINEYHIWALYPKYSHLVKKDSLNRIRIEIREEEPFALYEAPRLRSRKYAELDVEHFAFGHDVSPRILEDPYTMREYTQLVLDDMRHMHNKLTQPWKKDKPTDPVQWKQVFVRHPASWFEQLKERFLPDIAKKIIPVKYDTYYALPKVNFSKMTAAKSPMGITIDPETYRDKLVLPDDDPKIVVLDTYHNIVG